MAKLRGRHNFKTNSLKEIGFLPECKQKQNKKSNKKKIFMKKQPGGELVETKGEAQKNLIIDPNFLEILSPFQ